MASTSTATGMISDHRKRQTNLLTERYVEFTLGLQLQLIHMHVGLIAAHNVQLGHLGDQTEFHLVAIEFDGHLFGPIGGEAIDLGIANGDATIDRATGVLEAGSVEVQRFVGLDSQLWITVLEARSQCVKQLLHALTQLILFSRAFWQIFNVGKCYIKRKQKRIYDIPTSKVVFIRGSCTASQGQQAEQSNSIIHSTTKLYPFWDSNSTFNLLLER